MAAKPPPKPSPSNPQLHQNPNPPNLVGSVIEKGFSSSSSLKPPQPTVIPFPVARHRSHGPVMLKTLKESSLNPFSLFFILFLTPVCSISLQHWTPLSSVPNPNDDDEDEDLVDQDDVAGDVQAFANPIKRKEKKGLDFSRWKEYLNENGKKEESKKVVAKPVVKKVVEIKETVVERKESEVESRNLGISSLGSSRSSNGGVEEGREVPSLMDEIEAENLARLSEMSTNEIEEAQAEIMEKMDPGVVEMLKKRARSKKSGGGKVEGEKRIKIGSNSGELMKMWEERKGGWRDWSERVEKVRELRFGLDGSVVGVGSSAQEQLNGKLGFDVGVLILYKI